MVMLAVPRYESRGVAGVATAAWERAAPNRLQAVKERCASFIFVSRFFKSTAVF